VRCQLFPR